MDDSSIRSILNEKGPERAPAPYHGSRSLIPEGLKTVLLLVLMVAVGFLLYDSYQFQKAYRADAARISEQIATLAETGEAQISALKGELSQTRDAVGSTKAEIKKTAEQIQMEGQKTKSELSQALATKADAKTVQAIRRDAETKIGEVSSEVGGVRSEVGSVKTDVGTVKTELASTRRELEGTQRQLVDTREALTAAVAKNSTELNALRLRGERDYYEFTIAKKNQNTRVEDIQVVLKKTDAKKGKFTIEVLVDDTRIEKKDRNINEPIQFLVGKNRLRYELVLNWIEKDKAGGYLSIPK